MIEIKLAASERIAEICEKLGVENDPALSVYVATENGQVLGCCGFKMDGSIGELCFTSIEDPSLAPIEDGLLRSALALMLDSGVETAYCKGGVPAKMLKRLGFKEKDGVYLLELNNSFLTQASCCGCKE